MADTKTLVMLVGGPADKQVLRGLGAGTIYVPIIGGPFPFARYERKDAEECRYRVVYEYVPPQEVCV